MLGADIVSVLEGRDLALVVACTITNPADKDFDKLIRTRDELSRLLSGTKYLVLAAVFTGLKAVVAKETGERHNIAVIDRDAILDILAKLQHGDIETILRTYFRIAPLRAI